MRVLVVEDEPTVADAVRGALAREGHAVDVVADGLAAVTWVETYPYDLLILDVGLPGLDGFSLCTRVRAEGVAAPILMLTALDEVEDRVTGLDRGADDYLAKPFAIAELLARVRALLRRGAADRSPVIQVGDLELDPARHVVKRAGNPIALTAKEFSLLEALARHPGHVFGQDRLIDAVWDADFASGSNIVEVYVHSLRRKIDGGRRDGLIETVRGVGYRLRAVES
ncbi:MAG: response regulator transcription factor [Gaiellales bacterium]